MRRPITSTTRRDGFPISEWYMPLLLSSLISVADMLTVVAPLSWEVGDGFLTCSGIFPGASSLVREATQRHRDFPYT
jgi:hypothetical protein